MHNENWYSLLDICFYFEALCKNYWSTHYDTSENSCYSSSAGELVLRSALYKTKDSFFIIKSSLHAENALHIFRNSTDQQERFGAPLPDDHFTDGKMQLWCCASMFLEDASGWDRGSTFSTICQGYLRWTKQWSSHSNADSGRGPTLGSNAQKLFLSSKFSVCLNILSWGLLALSVVALCDHIFTFVCILHWCH